MNPPQPSTTTPQFLYLTVQSCNSPSSPHQFAYKSSPLLFCKAFQHTMHIYALSAEEVSTMQLKWYSIQFDYRFANHKRTGFSLSLSLWTAMGCDGMGHSVTQFYLSVSVLNGSSCIVCALNNGILYTNCAYNNVKFAQLVQQSMATHLSLSLSLFLQAGPHAKSIEQLRMQFKIIVTGFTNRYNINGHYPFNGSCSIA